MTYETRLNPEEEYDRQLDLLVDSGVCNYDDARRSLGPPPYELYEAQPIVDLAPKLTLGGGVVRGLVKSKSQIRGIGPRYGEETGVGYRGDEPHYYTKHVPWSDEQRETNRKGMEMVRSVLNDERHNI